MIFLRDNVLLEDDVTHDHIKPRLLGHWGTCPALILIYAHINRLICNTDQDMLYVVGPGKHDRISPLPQSYYFHLTI